MSFLEKFKLEKLDFITINRIVKCYNDEQYRLYLDKEELIKENPSLLKTFSYEELISLIQDSVYDELIILKSDIIHFSSITEFLIYSIVKANYIDINKVSDIEQKLLKTRQELSRQDFDEILGWGFFDLFNYEIESKLELEYSIFKEAFTFFEYPSKPLFAALLDNSYLLFINNSYT